MARFLYTLPWVIIFAAAMIAVAATAWRKWPDQPLAGIFARIGLWLAPSLWLHATFFEPPRNWFLSDGIAGFGDWFDLRRGSDFANHPDKTTFVLSVALLLSIVALWVGQSLRHAREYGVPALVLFAVGAAFLWKIPYEIFAVRYSMNQLFEVSEDTPSSYFDRELLMPLAQGICLTLSASFLLRHGLPKKEPKQPPKPVDTRKNRQNAQQP